MRFPPSIFKKNLFISPFGNLYLTSSQIGQKEFPECGQDLSQRLSQVMDKNPDVSDLLITKTYQLMKGKLKPHIEKMNELMRFEFQRMIEKDPQMLEAVSKMLPRNKELRDEISKMIEKDPQMLKLMNEKGLMVLPSLTPFMFLKPSVCMYLADEVKSSCHYHLEAEGKVNDAVELIS